MTTDMQTIDVYEREAHRYAGLELSAAQIRALDRFQADLPPASRILDLGCGPGLHGARMAAAGHDVDGIDATPAFVEAAKARGIRARLGTFDDLSQTDAYDGIYASFSLLHAPRGDLPRHITAIARALRPGGAVFLGMKTGEGESRDRLGRRYCYASEAELRAMLGDAGLTVRSVEAGSEAGLSGEVAPFVLIHARG